MILTSCTKKTILAWFFNSLEGVLDNILTVTMRVKNMREESSRSLIIILWVTEVESFRKQIGAMLRKGITMCYGKETHVYVSLTVKAADFGPLSIWAGLPLCLRVYVEFVLH